MKYRIAGLVCYTIGLLFAVIAAFMVHEVVGMLALGITFVGFGVLCGSAASISGNDEH